jgi:hypothetical protein
MVDGELWFGARGVSFTSLIVVGGLVGGHWGLEELWWRERLPLQVEHLDPARACAGAGIGQTVETATPTTTMHAEPGLMVGS